jgi:hypothetical protein
MYQKKLVKEVTHLHKNQKCKIHLLPLLIEKRENIFKNLSLPKDLSLKGDLEKLMLDFRSNLLLAEIFKLLEQKLLN